MFVSLGDYFRCRVNTAAVCVRVDVDVVAADRNFIGEANHRGFPTGNS